MRLRVLVLLATLVTGIVLGVLDYLSGPFLQFPFFFLLPIAFAAWLSGRPAGYLLALVLPLARPLLFYPIWKNGSAGAGAIQAMGFHVLAANAAIKILIFVLFAEMTHRIAVASRFRRQIISTMPIGLWIFDRKGRIVEASPAGAGIWGADAQGKKPESLGIQCREGATGDKTRPGIPGLAEALRAGKRTLGESLRLLRPDGQDREVLSSSVPIRDARGRIAGALLVQVDVSESKRLEREREHLIRSLRAAQEDIKILRGMLPICSGCKRIRDEKQAWVDLESYISSHSEADFTHGICPECVKEMYPWFTP